MKATLLNNISYALVLVLTFSSCAKDDDKIEPPIEEGTPATIYIGGYSNEIAYMGEAVWKNGIPMNVFEEGLLPRTPYTRYGDKVLDIDLVGDDRYAIWRFSYKYPSEFYNRANIYLWKNGKNTLLIENDPNTFPQALDIEGSDVYFGGYYIDQYQYPAVWKNGDRQLQAGGRGTVNDILVQGHTVLAVGASWVDGNSYAALWKNGVLTELGQGASFGANSIAQSGNDLYIAGAGYLDAPSGLPEPLLWKNGAQIRLGVLSSEYGGTATGVAVANGKVHIAGYAFRNPDDQEDRAFVWSDGKLTALSDKQSRAYSVAVKGNDVYVAGYEVHHGIRVATMWKSGTPEKLSIGTQYSEASSIKVK